MGTQEKTSTARRRAIQKAPSLYFQNLMELDQSIPLVLVPRVSRRGQAASGTLKRRTAHLKAAVKALGFKVLRSYPTLSSGYARDGDEILRQRFICACREANRTGAAVATHSWDRFIRSEHFKDGEWNSLGWPEMPTTDEYERLKEWSGGVTLACLWDVDSSPKLISSLEQAFKPKRNGNGKRYDDAKELLLPLLRLGRKRGLSYRELETVHGPSHMTIKRWLSEL